MDKSSWLTLSIALLFKSVANNCTALHLGLSRWQYALYCTLRSASVQLSLSCRRTESSSSVSQQRPTRGCYTPTSQMRPQWPSNVDPSFLGNINLREGSDVSPFRRWRPGTKLQIQVPDHANYRRKKFCLVSPHPKRYIIWSSGGFLNCRKQFHTFLSRWLSLDSSGFHLMISNNLKPRNDTSPGDFSYYF